jgi:hypothetical protein
MHRKCIWWRAVKRPRKRGFVTDNNYILDADNNPVLEPDVVKWAKWYEIANRHVGNTVIGGIKISTVFLGLDHNFGGSGPPVLWESMIFGGENDDYQERYTSYKRAVNGHKLAVDMVKKELFEKISIASKIRLQIIWALKLFG